MNGTLTETLWSRSGLPVGNPSTTPYGYGNPALSSSLLYTVVLQLAVWHHSLGCDMCSLSLLSSAHNNYGALSFLKLLPFAKYADLCQTEAVCVSVSAALCVQSSGSSLLLYLTAHSELLIPGPVCVGLCAAG